MIIGLIISAIGIVGCILPVIPGPALSYLALIILSFAKDWEPFSIKFLIITAILTVLVTILDYVVPAFGAKRYGASKAGIWYSVIGMVIGIFLFPPWGLIMGAFFGGLVGEILVGTKGEKAFKVGWGILIGNLVGTSIKLAFSIVLLIYYVIEMF